MPLNSHDDDWNEFLDSRSLAWKQEFAELLDPFLFGDSNGIGKGVEATLEDSWVTYSGFPPGPEGSVMLKHLLKVVNSTPPWEEFYFDLEDFRRLHDWDDIYTVMSRVNSLQHTVIALGFTTGAGEKIEGAFPLVESIRKHGNILKFQMCPEIVLLFEEWANG